MTPRLISSGSLSLSLVLFSLAVVGVEAWGQGPSITALPPFETTAAGVSSAEANGVSRNGVVAYGTSGDFNAAGTSSKPVLVRWSGGQIVRLLGNGVNVDGGAFNTLINGATADGQSIVGSADLALASGGSRVGAARWNAAGAFTELEPLEVGSDGYTYAAALAISEDGAVVAGQSQTFDASGGNLRGNRPVRWNAAGDVEEMQIPAFAEDASGNGDGRVIALSSDGSTAVGQAQRYDANGVDLGPRAIRWRSPTVPQELDSISGTTTGYRQSVAQFVSRDGSVVAGISTKYQAVVDLGYRPVRWSSMGIVLEMQNLGTDANGVTNGGLNDLSDDGSIAIGSLLKYDVSGVSQGGRGVRWVTSTGVATELKTIDDFVGSSYALAMTGDGSLMVGYSDTDLPGGTAAVWGPDGVAHQLYEMLAVDYSLDLTGWTEFSLATGISADGNVIVGKGVYEGNPAAFRFVFVDDAPSNAPPAITSPHVGDGEVFDVQRGESFYAKFKGVDSDRDLLTVTATGLPPSAKFEPDSGTTGASPLISVLRFKPVLDDVGTHEVTVTYRDPDGETASMSFTLIVPSNDVPTVAPLDPVVVECDGGPERVTFETVVDDPDGRNLTVLWTVDGKAKQRTTNVAPGTVVSFEYGYEDGETLVEVTASDGVDEASASSTVTVEDTTDPTVTIVENDPLATEPGQDFAFVDRIALPEFFDICDGDPTLRYNGPDRLYVGSTLVEWIVTDAAGNKTSVVQNVIVEDRERPELIGASEDIEDRYVDRGLIYALIKLRQPVARDNVTPSNKLKVTCEIDGRIINASQPYGFTTGLTRVIWRTEDAAGNKAMTSALVTIKNHSPVAAVGDDVVIETTKSDPTITLYGSASSDADGHKLKYAWSAPAGVTLKSPAGETTEATFKAGTVTTVKLIVTDEVLAVSEDSVKVTIKAAPKPVYSTQKYGSYTYNYVYTAHALNVGLYSYTNGFVRTAKPNEIYADLAATYAAYAYAYASAAYAMQYRTTEELDALLPDYYQCQLMTAIYLDNAIYLAQNTAASRESLLTSPGSLWARELISYAYLGKVYALSHFYPSTTIIPVNGFPQ